MIERFFNKIKNLRSGTLGKEPCALMIVQLFSSAP